MFVSSSENDPTWSYSQVKTAIFDAFFQVFLQQDPTRSYSQAKTAIFDTFFQVFLQQEGKNGHFLAWLSNQKYVRSIEIAFACLFLWHIDMNSAIFLFNWPPGSFHIHRTSKRINKHIRQYFSTSSLIARPKNGLLLLFCGSTDNCRCQIWLSLTDCSFVYDHFRRHDNLHWWGKNWTCCWYSLYWDIL